MSTHDRLGRIIAASYAFFLSLIMVADAYVPREGFVPDEETAVRIAEAVWIPIYGKEKLDMQKPFKAILREGVWLVVGSMSEELNGGVARAEILKKDGRITSVSHDK